MNIEDLLKETKELTERAKSNTIKISIPEKTSNELCNIADNLILIRPNSHKLKNWFLKDIEFKDGFIRKNVSSILNEPKYKKDLDLRIKELKKSEEYCEFLGDLSADKKEIEKTIDVSTNAMLVIARCLKNKTLLNINDLVINTMILFERLLELYKLCERYFQDTNGLEEYMLFSTFLNNVSGILIKTIKILENMS